MGRPNPHPPVMFLLAAFSRYEKALAWVKEKAVEHYGPVLLESPRFDFSETSYYEATMGTGLKKVFFAFEQLIQPERLVEIKLLTNRWEEEYAAIGRHPEPRPLNLDPGYLMLGKLVLASTKDFTHRIYLSQGIFAEVTLQYKHHSWQCFEYTFADYRRLDYQQFFSRCREALKKMTKP